MKPCELSMKIATVLPKLDGWCEVDKALALADAVIELKPDIVVEIGVFGGASLIPMALACQDNQRGAVVGIDPWTKAASVEGYNAAIGVDPVNAPLNADWWGKQDYEVILQKFLGFVEQLGISHRVIVQRMKSDDVTPPTVIDLLHIDGLHTDQAVRDVERFASRVRRRGLCFMDDIGWSGGGVGRAVDRLLTLGFVEIDKVGTGAMFKRTNIGTKV